jgi:AAA15 family ATPase/GTPase
MIINFSVQNFGSIKDKQILSFEATNSKDLEDYYIVEPIKGLRLLKLALIYGANASGKTTVLEALFFLRRITISPAEKKNDELEFYPFLFDENTKFANTIFAIEFVQNKIKYSYEIELNHRAIIREELYFYNPNKANVFRRTTNIEKQLTEINFGNKINVDKVFEKYLEANTLWNNTVLGGFLKTNIELFELKEVTDWFEGYLKGLVDSHSKLDLYITDKIEKNEINKNTIVYILNKADINISDIISIDSDKNGLEQFAGLVAEQAGTFDIESKIPISRGKYGPKNLFFEHTVNKSTYKLPIELESQGTKRYYAFAGLLSLLIEKSLMFSIDELESSLHPDLYIHFLMTYLVNSKKSQLLATTHNREILNNKDIFRNDAIWFTDKNEYNATELYSLADFDSKTIRKDISSVYNAYKIGKLGGVPHLGDYYLDITHEEK